MLFLSSIGWWFINLVPAVNVFFYNVLYSSIYCIFILYLFLLQILVALPRENCCLNVFLEHKFSLFSVVLGLYMPVVLGGYFVYGDAVDSNIVLSLSRGMLVSFANILMAIHLILAFLIIVNPVCQQVEQIFEVPRGTFLHFYFYHTVLIQLQSRIIVKKPRYIQVTP